MTVVMIASTPMGIAALEEKLARFERLNAVQYERREKLNNCAYTLHYDEGKEPDVELMKIVTTGYKKLIVTIVDENGSRLFYEGNEIVYYDCSDSNIDQS